VEVAKEKAGKRNVALEVSQVSETATLECDRKLLGRVLEEILDNAISYSDTARKVWFNVSLTLTGLLFEVKDEGIGIPPEQQGIVYTKFFRGQNIPPESIGAGLGLYISNELVKFMNGKIWFRSDSKDGTIFYVSLPQDMNQVGLANKQPAV
jgi:signal transduction histidine kinase